MSDEHNDRVPPEAPDQQPEKRPPQARTTPEQEQRQRAKAPAGGFDFNTTIQMLWNGQMPLVQTFWLYYFSAMFVLKLLSTILPGLGNMFYLLQLVWAGFMVKPIIVSADRYEGPQHWAMLAKVAAVVIAIAVLMDVLF